jgi:tetratricopeptide (TPR) repeat protein
MRFQKYLGVYSLLSPGARQKKYFFVWEAEPQNFVTQQLDSAFQPIADPERIPSAYFTKNFVPEHSILAAPIARPQILSQPEHLPRVDTVAAQPERQAPKSSEIKLTEIRMREAFRQTLLRLKRPRERQTAINALQQLAQTADNIVPKHKHMFRDFGVALRKKNLPDLALPFCQRVLELAPDDDHAHFNLARIFFILEQYNKAIKHIHTAMELNADETIYQRMLTHLNKVKLFQSSQNRVKRIR